MTLREQHTFPAPGSPWNRVAPDFSGYEAPPRDRPALAELPSGVPVVTVVGTVRDERVPLRRSLTVWARQRLPSWLTVEYLVLDDGSSDDPAAEVATWRALGLPVRCVRFRRPGEGGDRSCTLLFNTAVRRLVRSPLVLLQWWDRIPGSVDHLRALVEPHRTRAGILTSAISRHVGGSSSLAGMTPEALAATLALVPWRDDPTTLERVAGPIGGHCVPGQATESSGCVWPVAEFLALGGYDERYTARHGYPNVEIWRRALQSGLVALFPPDAVAQNFHQSHAAAGRDAKIMGWLDDPRVRRNQGAEWGALPFEVLG